MEFVKHNHPLILDENFNGGEKLEACYLCQGRLRSKLIHSVYRCSSRSDDGNIADDDVDCADLFVHKSCAELPLKIIDYYKHPQHPITLVCPNLMPYNYRSQRCSLCYQPPPHTVVYSCESCDLTVCLQCVTTPIVYHPSHNQHALALVERMADFSCDACGRGTSDLSSCKCSTCPFWIHTSCAILSSSRKFQFHTHPLLLAYSFPQQYLNFKRKCLICKGLIQPTQWLYYCAGCRIFVHISCAKTNPKTIMRKRDALKWSLYPISTVSAEVAGPRKEVIHHWSHNQHPLILRNPNIQLMSVKDNNEDSEDDTIIVCDGCTNPINSIHTSYYECQPCKYFLHRYCAELPKEMQPYKLPFESKPNRNNSYHILYSEISSSNLFKCYGCNYLKSGIYIASHDGNYKLDIGCAMLPRRIKHEAHEHPLDQAISS
ncbi:hypothetical protein DCAR_0313745 [Daucus carota subsp. sativus]|uniref:DC1 domain-containing protein n=1 Tax=Daucus carota subsp. sativus TaxID=79200 RepID=A0AAF0WSA0_DAUCS|nr:hypothetical protein DCAR_0313745 [Daucus carota subsp. sativus]